MGANSLLGKWGIAVEKLLGMDTLLSKRSVCPRSGMVSIRCVHLRQSRIQPIAFEALVALLTPREFSRTEGTKRCEFCDRRRLF